MPYFAAYDDTMNNLYMRSICPSAEFTGIVSFKNFMLVTKPAVDGCYFVLKRKSLCGSNSIDIHDYHEASIEFDHSNLQDSYDYSSSHGIETPNTRGTVPGVLWEIHENEVQNLLDHYNTYGFLTCLSIYVNYRDAITLLNKVTKAIVFIAAIPPRPVKEEKRMATRSGATSKGKQNSNRNDKQNNKQEPQSIPIPSKIFTTEYHMHPQKLYLQRCMDAYKLHGFDDRILKEAIENPLITIRDSR